MIPAYLTLAVRIRQELGDLERVVARAERGIQAARQRPEDQDLYIDSVALNMHDFYSGTERILKQIGSTVDNAIPNGRDWHQELLRQMRVDLPTVRPPVLSLETTRSLDEFLRFRHVVRNIYAFKFDPDRVARLVVLMRSTLQDVNDELLAFVDFLERVGG